MLFARDLNRRGIKLDRLLCSPLNDWTSATRELKNHAVNSEVHKCSLLMASEFKKTMESTSTPIQHQLASATARIVKENRAKLTSIVKTVIFCGQQNIPLRGHRDDSKYYDNTHNTGNFQKLLEFRVDAGDSKLQHHIEECKRNATYRSKTIQNEIIGCCADYITKALVDDIKRSGYYTVLADEATDTSNMEQLVLAIRYYSETHKRVSEVFMGFIECKDGTTGQILADKIVKAVTDLGLDMSLCRFALVFYLYILL